MANALFGYENNLDTGALTAGSEAPGLSISQLKVPQGSSATSWQTNGATTAANGAWFMCDAGRIANWQAFLLARTSLTPSAQVRWRVGDLTGLVEDFPVLDLDFMSMNPSAANTTLGITRAGEASVGAATYWNTNGDLVYAAQNEWRFTHAPGTGEKLGLLLEPARVNQCRNPRGVGAAAATTGSAPSNGWAATAPAGTFFQWVGTGKEGTTDYVDLRFYGYLPPTSSVGALRLYPAGNTVRYLTTAVGETWTFEVGLKGIVGEQLTARLRIEEFEGSTYLTADAVDAPYDSTTALASQRKSLVRTVGRATAQAIRPMVQWEVQPGTAYDFTVRIGNPTCSKNGTNFITNSAGTGGSAGTRGTAPTFSALYNSSAGLDWTILETGSENGMEYVDILLSGTATSPSSTIYYIDNGSHASASSGQWWTASIYMKPLPTTQLTNLRSVVLGLQERYSGGYISSPSGDDLLPLLGDSTLPLASSRCVATLKLPSAQTEFVRPIISISHSAGQIYFPFRISLPQLELGESATTPILPPPGTTGAANRIADISPVLVLASTNSVSLHMKARALTLPTSTEMRSMGGVKAHNDATSNGVFLFPNYQGASNNLYISGYGYTPSGNFSIMAGVSVNRLAAFSTASAYASNVMVAATNGTPHGFESAAGVIGAPINRLTINRSEYGSICYQRVSMFTKRLVTGQLRALTTTGSTLDAGVLTYDSGMVGAGVQAGYGQSLKFAPTRVQGRYCRCDIEDPSNPDGFISVGLAFAGPVWQPQFNISSETTTNTDAVVDEVVTRGGQEYPQYRYEQRRWDVSLSEITRAEVWPNAMEVHRAGRRGANVLFAPDPTGEQVGREAVFGRVTSQSDLAFNDTTGNHRNWRLRITERL